MDSLKNSATPIFSIGSVARLLKISAGTLRMYEREGLILPYKSKTNQRWYSHSDIERVRCIRAAIKEEKMSIEGIKRIHSLIPCWEIIGCSEKDRQNCEAFKGNKRGCWAYRQLNTTCAERDCRLCEVYTMAVDCGRIKETIVRATAISKKPEHHANSEGALDVREQQTVDGGV